jgi:uncharacterized protein YndB with AHSA1/START domain
MSDKIEKCVVLRAPLGRVWQAVADTGEFGAWFGVAFDGPFVAGTLVTGKIVSTGTGKDDAGARHPYEGKRFEFSVESIEPMRRISFRWHPFAVEPDVDYSQEPTTLIVFELEEVEAGTQLTICETGFDGIPLARRAKAFGANDRGWTAQMANLANYLAAETGS